MRPMSAFSFTPIQYEQRIVGYFDVLGWKNLIESAGEDSNKLGELRALLMMFSIFESPDIKLENRVGRITTFSDNVVVSIPYDEKVLASVLEGVARLQLGCAALGHLIRGAITVGSIFHNTDVVFGPALNRAHYLENKVAIHPRIIVDQDLITSASLYPNFLTFEDGLYALDPFTTEFVQSALNRAPPSEILEFYAQSSGANFPIPQDMKMPPVYLLSAILQHLGLALLAPQLDKDWEKPAWLFDRISLHLGIATKAADLPRQSI